MMKLRTLFVVPAAALLLAGCMHQGRGMGASGMGPSGPGPGPGSGMGMGMGGQGMGGSPGAGMGGDPAQTCAMYRQMTAGKSPAERQAAMEAQMRAMHGGSVDPGQARARMEMMERQCAQVPAPASR